MIFLYRKRLARHMGAWNRRYWADSGSVRAWYWSDPELRATATIFAATCKGDGSLYSATWSPAEGWRCTCPAHRTCAHVLALQAVRVRSA